MRRSPVAVALSMIVACGLFATTAPAQAATDALQSTDTIVSPGKRRVTVNVQVNRFAIEGRRVTARGNASSRVRTRDGMVRGQTKPVRLSVAAGSSCRVLYLRLDDLQVKLFGLNLNTSTVTVRIGGDDRRVLGRLFCQLAKAIRLERVTNAAGVARSLNRRLAARPMQVLGFRAALYARQAPLPAAGQAPSCALLDLTIGPLDLDLLGLIVNLYGEDRTKPVRVVATADPNGGVLGATLCKLANGQAVG